MLKTISSGMVAASIVEEIVSPSHNQNWDMGYFDHKFQLIGGNFDLIQNEIKALSHFAEIPDTRYTYQKSNIFVLSTVSFIFIGLLIMATAYLARKTNSSHFQKRMNNLIRVATNLRDEYCQKIRVIRARDELDRMDNLEIDGEANALDDIQRA